MREKINHIFTVLSIVSPALFMFWISRFPLLLFYRWPDTFDIITRWDEKPCACGRTFRIRGIDGLGDEEYL
ncbi:MAG TPA: hypothetical protein PKM59_08665 [Thermodesulfobacteriota bacterium]|nr:hypothetical protein [Thermodesulfobacteriota bacterium]